MSDSSATFLVREDLLWRVATFKSLLAAARPFLAYVGPANSENLITNEAIAKNAYSCNAGFTLSFFTLMSENLCEGPTYLPNRA